MRKCTTCKIEKPGSEYYPTVRYGKPYTLPSCKACYRAKTRDWNKANLTPERRALWTANNKAQLARIKDATFAAYGGYVCACCGETVKSFLTLDHIDGDGNQWRKDRLSTHLAAGTHTYRWLMNHGYPAGFQVLCMNCNWGKRSTGVCPHRAKSNDYPLVGVGSSDPKRAALVPLAQDEDIVSSASKDAAAKVIH